MAQEKTGNETTEKASKSGEPKPMSRREKPKARAWRVESSQFHSIWKAATANER